MSEGHFPYIAEPGVPDLRAMSAGEAARFGVALCDALRTGTPERGFHGALYPKNLTLDAEGGVHLGPPLTLKKEFTPDELEYLPPELFWNGVGGPATDVYAVGLLLYAACSDGRPAFTGDAGDLTADTRAMAVQRRMKGEEPREPKEAGDELSQLILRAIAFREEERWPDVESLRCALEDCSVFAAPVPKKRGGADVLAAAVGTAADAASVKAVERPAVPVQTAAPAKAPAPRPVAPGARNADVVVPSPVPPKPEPVKKAKPKPEPKPKSEPRPAAPKDTAPKKAKPSVPEPKPEPKKRKAQPAPIPDGRPKPVFDAANEGKKKKRSPLPILATILALIVIFLVVLYFLNGGSQEPDISPAPGATPTAALEPTPTPTPVGTPEPEASPSASPESTPEPTPEPTPSSDPVLSVSLAETGSASWDEAASLCTAQGGHLPMVRNQEDLTALIAAAEATGVSYVWLDAQRDIDGTWRWSDGTEVTFLEWFPGEPSGTDTDGTAENYLMLWKYNGVWGYNDMRADPGTAYSRYYGGKIAVFCQN